MPCHNHEKYQDNETRRQFYTVKYIANPILVFQCVEANWVSVFSVNLGEFDKYDDDIGYKQALARPQDFRDGISLKF